MAMNPFLAQRARRLWVFLLTALALFALLGMGRRAGRAMQMRSRAAGSAQLATLKPGETAQVVFEVARPGGKYQLTGNLLEKQDETHYRRTRTELTVAYDATTPIVMGKVSDVHPAAVLHVTAHVAPDRSLLATQIVVLTGYVTVDESK